MSVRSVSQIQTQDTALPVPLFRPLPSFRELIEQINHTAGPTTSLEGRVIQHPFLVTETVFSSPTRVETVDFSTGSSLASPEKPPGGFASKRRLDMSESLFPPSKKARTEDLPIATDPAMSPIALQGSRREISHDIIIIDEQFENETPSVEKLDKTVVKFSNGRTYLGQLKNGLFHGYGTLTFASGKSYTGDFKDGITHGFGKLTFSTGNYTGDFRNGKFHGHGVLSLKDTTYTGEFRDGRVYGQGMMTYTDGRPPLVSFFSQ